MSLISFRFTILSTNLMKPSKSKVAFWICSEQILKPDEIIQIKH